MSFTNYPNISLSQSEQRNHFYNELKFFPDLRVASACLSDANSILRNGASAVRPLISIPAVATAISGSALAGGVLGLGIGLSAVRDGYKKGKMALKHGDGEGVALQTAWGAFGAGYAGLSGVLITEGAMTLQGATVPTAVLHSLPGIGFAMNGLLIGYAAYGLHATSSFANQLEEKLKIGEREAFDWIRDQVSLNSDETKDCSEKEIIEKLQKKWNAFEFRTNRDCEKMVREKLPALMEKYDAKSAKELIGAVQKAVYKEKIKHRLFLLIAVVSVVAFVALSVVSMGTFAPVLFALSSLLWVAIDSPDIYNSIAEKCWSWHVRGKVDEPPCHLPIEKQPS